MQCIYTSIIIHSAYPTHKTLPFAQNFPKKNVFYAGDVSALPTYTKKKQKFNYLKKI